MLARKEKAMMLVTGWVSGRRLNIWLWLLILTLVILFGIEERNYR